MPEPIRSPRSAPQRPAMAAALALLMSLGGVNVPWLSWPTALLLPLVLYMLLARVHGAFGLDPRAFRRGRPAWTWVVVFALASTVGLLVWRLLTSPDLSAIVGLMPAIPLAALPLAGLAFAAVNAALEEVLFRGVIYDRLRAALGAGYWPHLIQAAAFGLVHLHGVPGGAIGIALAGSWGLGLSILREHSEGLLAPWLAHVAADVCIFAILIA